MATLFQQIICQKIISGGQTGVDRGTLDSCLENGFPCGGWCPKDRLAEDGKIDNKYPLTETKDGNYETRTLKNVQDSTGTLIIVKEELTGGTLLTHEVAKKLNKPVLIVSPLKTDLITIVHNIFFWIKENKINILNVAGPRRSDWEKGYHFSHQIISALILKIKMLKD